MIGNRCFRTREVLMRGAIIMAIFGAALVASPGAETTGSRPSDSLVRPCSQNGKVRMELSAGEYIVSGSRDERIHIRWSVRDADQLSRVHARADVRGTD